MHISSVPSGSAWRSCWADAGPTGRGTASPARGRRARSSGLRFKAKIPIDVSLRHEIILRRKADLSIPFTTDGQIAANKEVVLQDDKDLFPPCNVTFVLTRTKAQELGARAEQLIISVQKGLTTPVMQELNSRVDLDKQTPEQVARDYLQSEGYLPRT